MSSNLQADPAELRAARHWKLYREALTRAEKAEAERDALRAEVAALTSENRSMSAWVASHATRAEAAEAALRRVRALRDEWLANTRATDPWYWSDAGEELDVALSGPETGDHK